MTATATTTRLLSLAYDDGDASSLPNSVYVGGHDLAEAEALALARQHLAEWAEEFDYLDGYDEDKLEEARPRVDVGERAWLRITVQSIDGESAEWYTLVATPEPETIPVWAFEVNEHLLPRCSAEDCAKAARRSGRLDTRPMCRDHGEVVSSREEAITALARLEQAMTAMLGYDRGAFRSIEESRAYALRGLERSIDNFRASITAAATSTEAMEQRGVTLRPMRYAFSEWNRVDSEGK